MPLIANRYEPTGNAAWGGMSEVNECDDKNLARKVVLKRVFKTADFSRLMDEQKALLKLRSKHVVQLFDVVTFTWRADDITCLVLEYIDGQDLDKITFKPDVKYQKTLWQVASGIAEIHKAGVIHRDIKPPNIRLDTNGVVKIFDFGLARETGKDDKTTSKSGTLGYMAPELWGTTTISFSSAVDTYAFGRTALSLLNVQPHNEKPKPVSSGAVAKELPGLNKDLAHLIEGCLEMRPNDRPKMSEVCDLLGRDLLRDKHRARVGINGKMHVLNAGTTRERTTR
jgi:eukaryotic-like serine/threonine-protein kinase